MSGHRPQRTCLGCGARDDQGRLMRMVVAAEGELRVDRLGRGRGGYLHETESCWEAFCRKKSVYRAFHAEVSRAARERLVRALRDRKNGGAAVAAASDTRSHE